MESISPDLFDGKVCTRCGQWRLLEHYYRKRETELLSHCKACMREARKVCYAADPVSWNARSVQWAKENRDRVSATRAEWRKRNAEAIRAKEMAYREANAERMGERRKARDAANADRIKQQNAEYREANREKLREQARQYYAENKEACLERIRQSIAANPEHYRELHADWKRGNRDAVNASTHKRRARIKGNGGSWTAEEWQLLKEAYDFRCLMCGRREPEITLCFDHIVPVSAGGSNEISNGQPLCRSCNSKKHKKTLDLRRDE